MLWFLFRGFSIHYMAYLADIFKTGRWSSYQFWDVRTGESHIKGIIRSSPLQTSVKYIPQCCNLRVSHCLVVTTFLVYICRFLCFRGLEIQIEWTQLCTALQWGHRVFNEGSRWFHQWFLSWKISWGWKRLNGGNGAKVEVFLWSVFCWLLGLGR